MGVAVLAIVLLVSCGDTSGTTALTSARSVIETTVANKPAESTGSGAKETTLAPATTPIPETTLVPETTVTPDTTEAAETDVLGVYDAYDLESYMTPIWEGNTVYNESVMFVGKDDAAPLLYTPSEIISVRSCDLKTEYRLGVDYLLEDGKLILTENSSIPVMAVEEYYPKNCALYGSFASNLGADRPLVRWGEGDTFFRYQVFVTYRHEDSYTGFVPRGQSDKFPKTLEKLKKGEAVKIVYYGDSITEGYNTSGFIGVAPHAERWSEMSALYLGKLFGNSSVTAINTGVAGMDSVWGVQNLTQRVIDYAPDLCVLAFGMNDGGVAPSLLAQRLVSMAKALRREGCEVILVATMLPNKEAAGFWGNQHLFEDSILKLVEEGDLPFGVVQMSSLHASLLEKKPYYHTTGNNINHPNDFLARLYAQSIVECVTGTPEA